MIPGKSQVIINQSESLKSQCKHSMSILKALWEERTTPGIIIRQIDRQLNMLDFGIQTISEEYHGN